MSDNNKNTEYNQDSIQVLEGLEAVRKRPGMYIGTTGIKGLHHMIWEIVDNSIDEAMAGFATQVEITITKSGSVIVEDDGRGIPVSIHKKTGLPTLETVLTVLHAGGKFDSSTYKVSGGLHGVGASVVNALSSRFDAWVSRDGEIHHMAFSEGHTVEKLRVVGKSEKTGTKVEFFPDFTIMDENKFEFDIISDRLRQTAYLNKGLRLVVADQRREKPLIKEYMFEGGIKEFVAELNQNKEVINQEIIYAEGSVPGEDGEVIAEVAMQYNTSFRSNVVSYANNISTIEGGTHERGFFDSLIRILNTYATEKKIFKDEKDKLSREDIAEGLVAIISIKHVDPIFEGQTKGKLGNKDARKAVNTIFSESFERYLLEHPGDAQRVISKSLLAQKARFAAQNAKEATRKTSMYDIGSLPGKLADCSSKRSEKCELYIVEGDSAGGSAKLGRDREFQAILPLRGKVINAEKARIDKVFENNEIGSMITALGVGVGEEIDIEKLRYHKIVIMTDADVDGAHIRTLLLTFFYRYLRKLIEYGTIYIAQPPLFKITKGKEIAYAYNDEQKNKIVSQFGENEKFSLQRYKGLGEMDPGQLWETTMDPKQRKMLQVQIQDAASADLTFSVLMGDDVEPRRDFINENAKYAEIDV